jgi:hypothetical protein
LASISYFYCHNIKSGAKNKNEAISEFGSITKKRTQMTKKEADNKQKTTKNRMRWNNFSLELRSLTCCIIAFGSSNEVLNWTEKTKEVEYEVEFVYIMQHVNEFANFSYASCLTIEF